MKLSWILAAFLLSSPAGAEALDFGGWCSAVAHFPADRCLENRPEDRQSYDAYISRVAGYEKALNKRDADRLLEAERANRMGDVTPDQTRDHSSANEH